MEIIWVNGTEKAIKAFGRTILHNESTENAVIQIEWAKKKLAEPNVTYPNGRESHEVANETIDREEWVLAEYQLFS